jgi:hypothetical protein
MRVLVSALAIALMTMSAHAQDMGSGHVAAAPPSTDMNCRLPMPIVIMTRPNGIMPAAMW